MHFNHMLLLEAYQLTNLKPFQPLALGLYAATHCTQSCRMSASGARNWATQHIHTGAGQDGQAVLRYRHIRRSYYSRTILSSLTFESRSPGTASHLYPPRGPRLQRAPRRPLCCTTRPLRPKPPHREQSEAGVPGPCAG